MLIIVEEMKTLVNDQAETSFEKMGCLQIATAPELFGHIFEEVSPWMYL